jgi:hypothetical protein
MPDFIEALRRRLVELGCPLKQVRRLIREVGDHWEDLKQAAMAEGLSGADAETRANASLGDPLVLAEELMTALRRSSWWGRHFVVTFCLVPLLMYPILWALLLLLQMALGFALGYGWNWKKLHVEVNNPVAFHHLTTVYQFMDYAAIALVTLLFCWLARRAVVKLKWMVVSCAICSVCAMIWWGRIEPHSFFMGFSLNSHLHMPWFRGVIPLLVAGAVYVCQRRSSQRFREKVAF